jgi:dolichyl-phosphate-mannose--protein O-mannosyl transferase
MSLSETLCDAKDRPPDNAAAWDNAIWWILLAVAYAVRFFRLAIPGSVVFDEYHFGKFVDNIINRELLFDIHPPLGKLTLAALGYLFGYRPVKGFDYDPIGRQYEGVVFYPLREISAIFGTITVPLVYSTARQLDISWVGSILAACLYCFDNLNIIESRLILMDSQIMFYLVLSLYCTLKLWKTRPNTLRRYMWIVVTGFVCGCSISVKWTALATPALIAIVSFFGLHFLDEPLSLAECLGAGGVGIALYVFLFFIHFQIHTHDGPGAPFFTDDFKKTLIGHPEFDPTVTKPSFLWLFWYTNRTMFESNAAITTRHHWESYWYWWVVNWRGLLYYNEEEPLTKRWEAVYLLCNPIICWFCGICVAVMLLTALVAARYRDTWLLRNQKGGTKLKALRTCLFLLAGWLMNLLPYILVDRSAFVYHYLPGLLYAQLLSGVMMDQLPRRTAIVGTMFVIGASISSYLYFAPWIYCYPRTSEEHAAMRWIGRWD